MDGVQAPLSMEFSRQEYWSEGHSLLQGICLTQGLNPGVCALQADSLPSESPGKPALAIISMFITIKIIMHSDCDKNDGKMQRFSKVENMFLFCF